MNCKKLLTSVVAATMLLSLSGCYRDDKGVIDAAEKYADAIVALDADDIADLMEDDGGLEDAFAAYNSFVSKGEGAEDLLKAISDTMTYEIDSKSVESSTKDKKGSCDITFTLADYEGLYETVENARIEKYSVYDWQHYDFYEAYCYYIYAKEHCETIDKQGWTENRGGLLVYECLVCIFEIGDGKRGLDDDELKRLEPYYSEIEDIVTNKLMISKESYEEVRNAVCDEYGNVSLDACDAYAKEHLSEFR